MAQIPLTEEAKIKNKDTGAEYTMSAGSSYDPDIYNVINSDVLQPATEIPYVSPEEKPAYNIAGLNNYSTPALAETGAEKKAQLLTDELQILNDQLVGQSSYRAEQENAQDYQGLLKTKNDLSSQLKILQNEALAIPQQMQLSAEGRGMTAGGLAPLQTAELRKNSIQALTVSALLEAANGNLTTSQTLVDRAVAQKFDPIKEEIAAKTANLELILKSPEYTRQDKNRAQAQLDAQNAQKAQIDAQEAEQKEVWSIATTAAQNGADALTLQKIGKATTKEEALQIASEAGVLQEKTEEKTDIRTVQGGLYDVSNGKWIVSPKVDEEEQLAPTSFNIKAGISGMTKSQVNEILNNTNPPEWFIKQANETLQQTLTPPKLNELWNEYAGELKTKIESAAKGDDEIENPFK